MVWFAWAFALAVVLRAGIRLWLATRQIAAVEARRSKVPRLFEDDISVETHERSADYSVARMRITRVGAVVGAIVALALTFGGGIAAVDRIWRGTALEQPWLGLAVVLTVLGLLKLVEVPFALYRTFGLEARFGFNRMTPQLFISDLAKRTLIGAAVAAPITLGALLLIERSGPLWWLYAWAGWLAVTLGLTWAWPRVVAPWFNRFEPLADRSLAARLEALLERCGFASGGLFVMDGSRRSAHGNAYFTGVGRHKRIVFLDTLLTKLDPPEIEAVLAHELGHFRLKHVSRRLVASALISLAGLALLGVLAAQPSFYTSLGVPTPSPHAALLLFVVCAPAFTFFATPLGAWWSRRHELEADDFAIEHTSARDLANALVKLYRDNAANLTPDKLYSAFYDTHPPALVRVARLRAIPLPRPSGAQQAGVVLQ